MADPSVEHWYPTAAYLYTLHLDGPALAWNICAEIPTTGATGCAVVAGLMRRTPGACACWKTRPWMRETRIRPGSLTMMPWCSFIPMPTHRPKPTPSSSGASPAAST
ncbi:hypothetical protein [Klebsiella variicola]|uniref:hypothetical protein n=1 Tax=Klebsiella variicola TaxID=244366 RepID=UPI004038387E